MPSLVVYFLKFKLDYDLFISVDKYSNVELLDIFTLQNTVQYMSTTLQLGLWQWKKGLKISNKFFSFLSEILIYVKYHVEKIIYKSENYFYHI